MNKAYIVLLGIIFIPALLIVLNDNGINSNIEDNIEFKKKLSQYGLFQGKLSDLTPIAEAEQLEVSSALFTDYAEKQRILVLPQGGKMVARGSGLPDFPDGTILAKTFFYVDTVRKLGAGKRIIETRLLIKHKSQWNAATYRWNERQDDAFLLTTGDTVAVTFWDEKRRHRKTAYKIPSRADCIACHRQGSGLFPIGPKLRNLNVQIDREDKRVNQLAYLRQRGKLELKSLAAIDKMTDYKALSTPLDQRARAYLDINCAHCHSPGGIGGITQLDLRYETPVNETGILFKQAKIAGRITISGELHMPKIGTTVPHDEGIRLILDYIEQLDKKK